VGSGKNWKGHIEFGKTQYLCLCVVDGWQTQKKRKKQTPKMDIIDDTDKQSQD
jgi:hypothetical protein